MSDIPKKFKDAEALAKAYESLEKDYTRKCQELKQLKKEAGIEPEAEILYFKVVYTDRALNEIVKTIPAAPWSDILPLAFSAKYKKAEWKLRSIQAVWSDLNPLPRQEPFDREKWLEEVDIDEE